MDIKKLLSTMAILGLFVFSMMSFIIITQTDSSVANKITDNELINETYGDLEVSLSSTSAQTSLNTFGENPPTDRPLGEISPTSVWGPLTTGKTIILGLWAIFVELPMQILGVSQTVITIIYSLLFIFLIIAIWAVIKGAIPQ